jgi:hypothetical protein
MSLRDELLGLFDIKTRAVEVAEWGRTVLVKTLTAAEVAAVKVIKDEMQATLALVAAAVCDDNGKRVFTDQDAAKLAEKSFNAVNAIAMAALIHNGMTGEAVDEAGKG